MGSVNRVRQIRQLFFYIMDSPFIIRLTDYAITNPRDSVLQRAELRAASSTMMVVEVLLGSVPPNPLLEFTECRPLYLSNATGGRMTYSLTVYP